MVSTHGSVVPLAMFNRSFIFEILKCDQKMGIKYIPRFPMPGIPPKPPSPNGDCAGSGAGAPLLPLITEFFLLF